MRSPALGGATGSPCPASPSGSSTTMAGAAPMPDGESVDPAPVVRRALGGAARGVLAAVAVGHVVGDDHRHGARDRARPPPAWPPRPARRSASRPARGSGAARRSTSIRSASLGREPLHALAWARAGPPGSTKRGSPASGLTSRAFARRVRRTARSRRTLTRAAGPDSAIASRPAGRPGAGGAAGRARRAGSPATVPAPAKTTHATASRSVRRRTRRWRMRGTYADDGHVAPISARRAAD